MWITAKIVDAVDTSGNPLERTRRYFDVNVLLFTGLLMLKSIRTPLFVRDPYFLSDAARGITYVSHGLAGTGLVGLVIAHVYFAVRPEKWWITKSMILGWITRRQYLEHHEPSRWRVGSGSAKPAGRV